MRLIHSDSLEDIAIGATVLGTGGGGDPYIGKLMAMQAIRECGPVRLIPPDEVEDDALVALSFMMGAPTVMVEKVPNGTELVRAFQGLERYLGSRFQYVACGEAGGLNSTTPFIVAARLGIPLVDADGIGRAFPEVQMVTPTMFGIGAAPMCVVDEKGNEALISAVDNHWAERIGRRVTVEMGAVAMVAGFSMAGEDLKATMIHGTLSRAEELGRTIREAHTRQEDPVAAVKNATGGIEVFRGRVTDVLRRTEKGWVFGHATLAGTDEYGGRALMLKFQNEHLVAELDGEIVVTVPDLIVVLSDETALPITTEGLRYGFRVVILGIPCDPKWRTAAGLALAGPRYFGYETDYIPVEERFSAHLADA
jgi:hypothetical protein